MNVFDLFNRVGVRSNSPLMQRLVAARQNLDGSTKQIPLQEYLNSGQYQNSNPVMRGVLSVLANNPSFLGGNWQATVPTNQVPQQSGNPAQQLYPNLLSRLPMFRNLK